MSRTMVIARIDVAGSVTWIENVSCLLPLLGALRLLRGLLRRSLLTFRHCALQVRDGAIENVQSRIDMHSNPITPECKKQRLHLTKRVLARILAHVERGDAHRVKAQRIGDQPMQFPTCRSCQRCATCSDKIRTIRACCLFANVCLASSSASSHAQFRHLRSQAVHRIYDRKIFFVWRPESGPRRSKAIANRTNRPMRFASATTAMRVHHTSIAVSDTRDLVSIVLPRCKERSQTLNRRSRAGNIMLRCLKTGRNPPQSSDERRCCVKRDENSLRSSTKRRRRSVRGRALP